MSKLSKSSRIWQMSERKDNEAGINISYCDPRFWKARIWQLIEDRIYAGGSHCILLHQIPFKEDDSDSLIFGLLIYPKLGKEKKFLQWPSEIACQPVPPPLPIRADFGRVSCTGLLAISKGQSGIQFFLLFLFLDILVDQNIKKSKASSSKASRYEKNSVG